MDLVAEIDKAIAWMSEAKWIHEQWVERFQAHPELEEVEGRKGRLGDIKFHEKWIERYEKTVSLLARLRTTLEAR